MSMPMPPQLQSAQSQLSALIEKVEQRPVDLLKESWSQIEKSLIKILGGPFQSQRPEHQMVALGLASALGGRFNAEFQAFWFPYRETPEGAAIGFPEALIMLAPFGAVVDALASAKLEKLDDILKDIRGALAQVKFSGGQPMRLSAEDYMRLFDPGFVQILAIDGAKRKQTWDAQPEKISRDVRDAVSRAAKLKPEVKKQLEQQFVTALSRMDPSKSLLAQIARAPRVVETMGILFAGQSMTGAAAEELWSDVVMPLLMVGAPEKFPPLDEEEMAAAKQGADPLFLFLEVVPYEFSAPDEDGLLGVFPPETLALPDPAFAGLGQVRLIKLSIDALKPALEKFDATKSRDAVKRFAEMVQQKVGSAPSQNSQEAAMMLDAALSLLTELKSMAKTNHEIYVRRLTEAEAASDAALAMVREALSAPRIILAP